MANHKSAIKRHKQSLVRRERNKTVKSSLKTVTKKVEAAIADKNAEEAVSSLKIASVVLDKAASKGVIHKNTAARSKSRMTRKVNALSK
ncbi:MAG: 30S ribosomal protein S20 [Deltaproteobacteria bacterium]|nr:30S ribosomal protein S20 [Deltaproteobacteria bacterium]